MDDSSKGEGRRVDLSALLKGTPPGKAGGNKIITDYRKEPQEGVEEVEKMIEGDPDNLDLQDWLAFMHYSNSAWDKALEIYKRLLGAGFRPASQHLYIGNCYYKKGLTALAMESWRKAASLEPDGTVGRKATERLEMATQEAER